MISPERPKIQEHLQRLFAFRQLTEAQIEALTPLCTLRHFGEGELIFSEGEPAHTFFVVLSGRIKVFKTSSEGKEIILHLFGAGEFFAIIPVFSDLPHYPANCVTLEDSEILSIQGKGFRELIARQPDMALTMLTVFAKRLQEFNELIEDLSLRTVDSRLARYLLSVSENSPGKAVITIHKKTLASILGTIPETLSRSFRKLSSASLIKVEAHRIHLLDRAGLEDLAK